jgi:secondary thiamine-phosphate synthase enzyme
MKSHTEYLSLYIPNEVDFLNITAKVEDALRRSGIKEGLCLVNSMHLSSSVFMHSAEQSLKEEQQSTLELMSWLQPSPGPMPPFAQESFGGDDLDPQHRRRLLGREVVVAVTRGQLDFGPAEQIFYGEFDGGREKRVLIKIIGE